MKVQFDEGIMELHISEEHDDIGIKDTDEFLDYREDRPCYNEIFCECRDCDECSFRDTD